MTTIDTVQYVAPSADGGWGPVTHAARLAAELFGASLVEYFPAAQYSRVWRGASLIPRPVRRGTRLSIVAHPGDLLALRPLALSGRRYQTEAVWIFDSFWHERIPRFVRESAGVDILFITDAELVPHYRDVAGVPVHWLPWGTDTQSIGTAASKTVDVLRVGRQPEIWSDDDVSRDIFSGQDVRFEGRPRFGDSADQSRRFLIDAMAGAKMVMAWGNAVSPAPYTHPTLEYISGRWTDAVANGAQVLGIPPQCAAVSILPDEALIVPESDGIDSVLTAVGGALRNWSPELALRLRAHAVEHLDWRHRFDTIRDVLDADAPRLDRALEELSVLDPAPTKTSASESIRRG